MSQNWKDDPDGEEDVQMPLGTGDAAPTDESYVSDKPKVNTSTVALFVTFAAALVVLYLLGLQNKPRAASAEQLARQAQVGNAIDEMIHSKENGAKIETLLGDIPRLVKILREYLGSKAQEEADLAGNPFERDEARAVNATALTPVIPVNADEAQKLRRVADLFQNLKVQSIMIGRTPVAMVNNRMVTIGAKFGDKGGELLTVKEIQSGRVVLSDGKNSYELKLDKASAGQIEDPVH